VTERIAHELSLYSRPLRSQTRPLYEQVTPRPDDPTDSALRLQVVDRLRLMNTRQAMHAWDRRRGDPLGPHGLAFLYYDLEPFGGKWLEVKAGTRLFLDGDDVQDLPSLLRSMAAVARNYAEHGRLDPLTMMANRSDAMSPQARFAGIAVSSLDSPEGPWRKVQKRALGPLDVSGRCYAILTDGTKLLIDRNGMHTTGRLEIQSTGQLEDMTGSIGRSWTWLREGNVDTATRAVWSALELLHHVLVDGLRRTSDDSHRPRH
jgi:hypothetical protein